MRVRDFDPHLVEALLDPAVQFARHRPALGRVGLEPDADARKLAQTKTGLVLLEPDALFQLPVENYDTFSQLFSHFSSHFPPIFAFSCRLFSFSPTAAVNSIMTHNSCFDFGGFYSGS